MTLLIGVLALLRASTVIVNGWPGTASVGASIEIESGAELIVSAYASFFTKVALEPCA